METSGRGQQLSEATLPQLQPQSGISHDFSILKQLTLEQLAPLLSLVA